MTDDSEQERWTDEFAGATEEEHRKAIRDAKEDAGGDLLWWVREAEALLDEVVHLRGRLRGCDSERWTEHPSEWDDATLSCALKDDSLTEAMMEPVRKEAARRLRGGEGERLHREAKRDVSRLMQVVEDLEAVRVTCHNGHTSTLRELRVGWQALVGRSTDPEYEDGEVVETYDTPSWSGLYLDRNEALDSSGYGIVAPVYRAPVDLPEHWNVRDAAPDTEGREEQGRHDVTLVCLVCGASVRLPASDGAIDLSGLFEGWSFNPDEGWTCPYHGSWPNREEGFRPNAGTELDRGRPEEAGGEDTFDPRELSDGVLACKLKEYAQGSANPLIHEAADRIHEIVQGLRRPPEGAGEADCYAKAKMGSLTLYVPCETRDIKMAAQGMVAILRPVWQEEWECVPTYQTMHAPHLPDDATVVGLRTGRKERDDG